MLVFFGSRSSKIKSNLISEHECPLCGSEGTLSANIHGKYAHIYWIPLFPIGQFGKLYCQFCEEDIDLDDMDFELIALYETNKPSAIPPIWHFTGAIILLSAIFLGSL